MRLKMIVAAGGRWLHELLPGSTRTKLTAEELQQLADSILEYGRMQARHYAPRRALIRVDELAARYRETPKLITRALLLLEQQQYAHRLPGSVCWSFTSGSEFD